MEEHGEDNTSLKDAVTSDRSIMNSRGQAVQRVVSRVRRFMVAITYNYVIVARLFLCGARHACLRHRRLNRTNISFPRPFFSFARSGGSGKRGFPLCRNFAIFPLCRGARVLRAYERIEGKSQKKIFFFSLDGGKKVVLANNCSRFPCFFFLIYSAEKVLVCKS